MSKQRSSIRAGLFILIAVALIFTVAVGIQGFERLFAKQQLRSVTFTLKDDLGGLREGDDVRIGGFKVGVVKTIELLPASAVSLPEAAATQPIAKEPTLLRVTFTMPAKYAIHADARVGIQGTVTGQSWVNFESLGSPAAPALPDRISLVGRPSPFSGLLASLGETGPQMLDQLNTKTIPAATGLLTDARTQTIPRVNTAVDTATGLLTDARTQTIPRVNSILDDVKQQTVPRVNTAADKAAGMMSNIGDTFGESKADFKTTINNLATATSDIRQRLPEILDRVKNVLNTVQTGVDKVNVALDDVQKTVVNTRDMTAAAKGVLAGNKGKLDGMIASLKATSDNLKNASAEIRHAPWRLLYKPAKNEIANLNLFDSARQFADGASDLADAAQALRDAASDKATPPENLQRLMTALEDRFTRFTEVEQKLWKSVQE